MKGYAKRLSLGIVMLVVIVIATTDHDRQDDILDFIKSRDGQSLMCLYTFDRIRASKDISVGPSISVGVDEDAMLVTVPPSFEEHIGEECPFGDLQLDPELVRSLSGSSSEGKALGVHLTEDATSSAIRPQIASNDVVEAKRFFAEATTGEKGYTFEFVYRRRVMENRSMTLFSISNRFGECTDQGFRLDVDVSGGLLLIYSVPEVKNRMIRCVEQRVYSAPCTFPIHRLQTDENPAVHVTMTIKALKHRFFVRYIDPVTMKAWECDSNAYADVMNASTAIDYIRGTYRLFIGNNPRNVSAPLSRPKLVAARSYRHPGTEDLSPEERLRAMIKRKIDSIHGPRLPASLRIFGGKALSLQILGLPFAPINEDSPFAWIRDQITKFKDEHGSDIVDFVINSLRGDNGTMNSTLRKSLDSDTDSPTSFENGSASKLVYPNVNPSVFDLFHFAIYKTSLDSSTVKRSNWANKMIPFRPFMQLEETMHIKENEEAILSMMYLHSVFDDIQLEITDVPQLGRLFISPTRLPITKLNLTDYKNLPSDQQREIIFVPDHDLTNKNIPHKGAFGFTREFEPYAVIRYRIWKTTTVRVFNPLNERVVRIFVDPKLMAPLPKAMVTHIYLKGFRHVELDLGNVDQTPHTRYPPGLDNELHADSVYGKRKLPDVGSTLELLEGQVIRISKFPRYGRVYDRAITHSSKSALMNGDNVDAYRIHRDQVANRTFSTLLLYVPDENIQHDSSSSLDEIQFQLGTNQSNLFSEAASIFLTISMNKSVKGNINDAHQCDTITTIRLREESEIVLTLSQYEPLWGHLCQSVSFRVRTLPEHGHLYQESPSGVYSLITEKNVVVDDPEGRLVYAPNVNYFNVLPPEDNRARKHGQIPLDGFTFEIVELLNHHNLSCDASHFPHEPLVVCAAVPRKVQIEVVNTPDDMVFLPPTTLQVLGQYDEPVAVPVLFEDPDSLSASYRATLDGSDDVLQFIIGDGRCEEDVLKHCPRYDKCRLNGSVTSIRIKDNESRAVTHHFQCVLEDRIWRSNDVTIEGSKAELQAVLANLTIIARKMPRDKSVKFRIKIEKLETSLNRSIETTYDIDYLSIQMQHASADSFSQSFSNLMDVISLLIWVMLVGSVLSSTSCCSMGFCCCCSRARLSKRQDLENEHRIHQDHVVQNDFEYSGLLESMWDVFCEDNYTVSIFILRVCTETRHKQLQDFAWRSMKPLLVATNREYEFVEHLVLAELGEHRLATGDEMNTLSGILCCVLASRHETEMSKWLLSTLRSIKRTNPTAPDIIDAIDRNLTTLPKQVLRLCRVCETLHSRSQKVNRHGVHLIFFDYFFAQAFLYARRNALCTDSEMEAIVEFADVIERSFYGDDVSSDDWMTCASYNRMLDRILETPVTPTNPTPREIDFDLLGWCMMNLHCVLEALLPEFEKLELYQDQPDTGTIDCRIAKGVSMNSLHKLRLILPALGFPFSRIDVLLSMSELTPSEETQFSIGSNTHDHSLQEEVRCVQSQASLLSLYVGDEDEPSPTPSF